MLMFCNRVECSFEKKNVDLKKLFYYINVLTLASDHVNHLKKSGKKKHNASATKCQFCKDLSNFQYLIPSHNIQQHLGAADTKHVHQNTSKLGLLGFFDLRVTVREIISFFLNFLRFQAFLLLTIFQNVTPPYC
jgi:hypothetical protein